MSNPANHQMHYIPKMYLKAFADEKGMIWSFPKDPDKKPRRNHIRKICKQRGYYTLPIASLKKEVGIEQYQPMLIDDCFTDIEDKAAIHIANSTWDKNPESEIFISEMKDFIACMMVRVPKWREKYETFILSVCRIHNALLKFPDMPIQLVENTDLVTMIRLAHDIRILISNASWSFFSCAHPVFITSDNPVIWKPPYVCMAITPFTVIELNFFEKGFQGHYGFDAHEDIVFKHNDALKKQSNTTFKK